MAPAGGEPRRVFITGIDGFVGRHLAALLHARGIAVSGLRAPFVADAEPLPHGTLVHTGEINDPRALADALAMGSADGVVHLAAQSHVGLSWRDRRETFVTNILGTATLLDAVRTVCPEATVLVVGSAEIYGPVPESEQPIGEDRPLDPRSPYAVSKAAAEMLSRQMALADGLRVVMTRSFNHTGPGQSPAFVASNFAHQIAMIEAGASEPVIRVGNLEPKRDFADVRDVCAAYLALLSAGVSGEAYNVCSGAAITIGDLLSLLLGHARTPIEVRIDPERVRRQDIPMLLGDGAKLDRAIGTRSVMPLGQSLLDLLEWWRGRVGGR